MSTITHDDVHCSYNVDMLVNNFLNPMKDFSTDKRYTKLFLS
ncbi:hypothetical protein [Notoacmeibacter sp. MSK16QG-6]|nr:hypothetical protein [Notoacmeibacter sp. MSK16QG-6]